MNHITQDQAFQLANSTISRAGSPSLHELTSFCNAAIEWYIAQQAATEPVAYLWQHSETGRTRILSTGDRFTDDGRWFQVGPLYLGVKV